MGKYFTLENDMEYAFLKRGGLVEEITVQIKNGKMIYTIVVNWHAVKEEKKEEIKTDE